MHLNHAYNKGAKCARETRAALGLDPDAPLTCALRAVEDLAELPVVVGPLRDGLAGAIVQRGAFRLVFLNGAQAVVRQRFTLAHELGHVRLGHEGPHEDAMGTLGDEGYDPVEVQANAFAAEFLVPRTGLEAHRAGEPEPNLDVVVELACLYGVSALMLLNRLARLKLVGEERRRQLRAEIDANLHFLVQDLRSCEAKEDGLTPLELPYVSPSIAGTALGALLGGQSTLEDAACAAGVTAAQLRVAVHPLFA